MNAAMMRALALDAFYQVLDNKVFRVLMILVLVPVLVTFLVGFRDDGVVLLFGVQRWSWDGILGFAGGRDAVPEDFDIQAAAVSGMVKVFVDFVGGVFGVILAIAATAFFVPRLLEKGAADVVFHKPVPRFYLYLSRYFAGLLFIALLSALAVCGMYLGFLLVSGYNDPGILWGAVVLTYVFGLVHAFSMFCGALTRSSVAAILLTLLFMLGNSCVHQGWILKQGFVTQADQMRSLEREVDLEEERMEDAAEEFRQHAIVRLALGLLDGLHYALPKTTDASLIASKLRAAIRGKEAFYDSESRFVLLSLEGELVRDELASAAPPIGGAERLLGAPVLAAKTPDGERRLVLWSRERGERETEVLDQVRRFPESGKRLSQDLVALVSEQLGLDPEAIESDNFALGEEAPPSETGFAPSFLPVPAYKVSWSEGGRQHVLVLIATGPRVHALAFDLPADEAPEAREEWLATVLGRAGVRTAIGQTNWYEEELGWTSPWRYNIFFSVGSSLVFAAVMLALGGRRVARIDF